MGLTYAIIGTGAIGGYYGARLQQAGCEVHFLLHSDYEHVRDRGLTIDSIDGDFTLPKVRAYSSPKDIPPVDVAVVALKTTNNALIAELMPPLKPNGAILSLQNGIGIEADIVQRLKKATDLVPTVLGGLCFICSNKVGDGHIRHIDYGKVLLGAYDETNQPRLPTPLMESIAADFTHAGIAIDLTADLPMARWRKLVWNVPYNGLSVVLDATTEEMMNDDGVREIIIALMQEVITTANAWGKKVSPEGDRHLPLATIDQMLAQTEKMSPYRTSMKIDYDEGRPLEIETILDSPIAIARSLGVSTPTMLMLYQQLAFLSARNCRYPILCGHS
ncbi:MAG: putative 2-dehydropantoate 2-reductase [Phormidesmis sp.]